MLDDDGDSSYSTAYNFLAGLSAINEYLFPLSLKDAREHYTEYEFCLLVDFATHIAECKVEASKGSEITPQPKGLWSTRKVLSEEERLKDTEKAKIELNHILGNGR